MKISRLFSFYFFKLAFLLFITPLNAQNPMRLSPHSDLQEDLLLAKQYLEEGEKMTEAGSYQTALEHLQKAQNLYSRYERWEEAIESVIRLAKLADHFESTDLKIKYGELALNLTQQHLPKDHPVLAAAFRQKAETLMVLEMLDSANYFLTKAIPLFEQQEAWTEVAWSKIMVGVNYLNQYQLDSCQKHFSQVKLLIQEQSLALESRKDIQSTLLELSGVLYQFQGNYSKAIENAQEALDIDLAKTKRSGIDSFFIAEHFNNLGALYLEKGDYQRALDHFMQALYSYKKSSTDQVLLYNIGELLIRQEKYSEAIHYFQKSLSLIKEQQDGRKEKIDAFNGLGFAYRMLERYDTAMYYCQQALSIPLSYRKFMTRGILGNIYIHKGQAQEAIMQLKLAIKNCGADSTGYTNSSFFISRLYYLCGNAHFLNRDTTTALKFYQKALVSNHKHFKDSLNELVNPSLSGVHEAIYFLETMRAKARTLANYSGQTAQMEAALATYQLTIQWIDTLQISYVTEATLLDWSSKFKSIYEEAIQLAYQGYQSSQDIKYLHYAFTLSEKSKNAILLETLKSAEGKSLAGIPDTLIQKERDLNLDIVFYEKTLQKARAQKEEVKAELYQEFLSKARLSLIALKEQLEQDYPKFREWKYANETTSIDVVQSRLLDHHTAFLEYFLGENKAFVFVITKETIMLLPLSSPQQITSFATDFDKMLSSPGVFEHHAKRTFENYKQKAFAVYQNILQASLSKLPSDIQKLIIAADGILNLLPFEALIKTSEIPADFDFAKLPYLIYDYQFQYTYSAGLLLKNQARSQQIPSNTKCLAFAPPYKGLAPIAQRGPLEQLRNTNEHLEGTANEIRQISRFIGGQFHFDTTATEYQFKALVNQFGLIHLAMHGAADFENSNFNYLKFSDLTPDSLEDNLLHHYEIANMDLQAQLVVLSACETGTGKYEEGEGVFSLARSFMYAGVPSVVMSLWKVSDASTSQLMPYFYENLGNGQPKSGALRQAKLRFLNEANLEHRHPFYWSAFVLMGDDQELKRERSNLVWWGMALFLFFAYVYFSRFKK